MMRDDVDTAAWLIGLVLLGIGTGALWGWAAACVAIGAILAVWPLVKQFR